MIEIIVARGSARTNFEVYILSLRIAKNAIDSYHECAAAPSKYLITYIDLTLPQPTKHTLILLHTIKTIKMPSYLVTGVSRGLGVCNNYASLC